MASVHDEFDAAPSVHDEFDAAPVAAPARVDAPPSEGEAFLRGAGSGALFGLNHQINGFTQALMAKAMGDKGGFGDLYRRNRDTLTQEDEAAQNAHAGYYLGGNLFGGLATSGAGAGLTRLGAAIAPRAATSLASLLNAQRFVGPMSKGQMLVRNMRNGALVGTGLGGLAGIGASRGDLTQGEVGQVAEDAGIGSLFGAGIGGAAPAVVSGLGSVASGAADAMSWLGGKVANGAGWLKVNSLHPVPTLGEDMAALPGGKIGVGKTLLQKGLGGLTKDSTAEQIAAALRESSGNIDRSAASLDAMGAKPPDLGRAVTKAAWRDAAPLMERPLTRGTGEKLGNVLSEYDALYSEQPSSFLESLKFRRELDDAIYKNDAFGASPELSDFGKALRPLRSDVNQSFLDSAEAASPELADQFRAANLETRQLGMASRAADRVAGRGTSSHVIGLKDLVAAGLPAGAGVAGLASGHGGAGLGAGAASWLLGKYGSQAGARSLYTLARLAQSSPRLAQLLAQQWEGPAAATMMSRGAGGRLMDMLPSGRGFPAPAYASGGP